VDATDVDATTMDRDEGDGRGDGNGGPGHDRTVIIDPTKLQ
jgi:hypothetical protein